MKKLVVTLVAFISMTVLIMAQSKDGKKVADAVERLRQAMVDGNKAELESLVAEKLSYGHSGGHIDDKKEFVEKLTNGSSDFVTIELTGQTISISKKTAVVRHQLKGRTNDGGKPGEVNLRILLVWQKLNGKWILLARQAVRVS